MYVTLYKSSPEGRVSIEIEQHFIPKEVAECLEIPSRFKENIDAGWDYWWDFDDISDKQRNCIGKESF